MLSFVFENYTARARRVVFFAAYEASQVGSTVIEPEHLLLGLIREDRISPSRFLPRDTSESIRSEIERRIVVREKVTMLIGSPLSPDCKRVLAYATEEAVSMNHGHVSIGHLLMGMLRE